MASPVSSSGGHSTTSPSHGNSPIASSNDKSPIMTSDGNSPIPSTGTNSKSEHSSNSPRRLKPHSIESQQAFASLESGLDVTVGDLNFFVDKDGVQDLLDTIDMEILDNLSTASATPSILAATSSQIAPIQAPSDSATSMDDEEFRKAVAKNFGGSEVESAFRPNNSTESLEGNFDCTNFSQNEENLDDSIYLADFNGPEVQANHEIFTCNTRSLDQTIDDQLDYGKTNSKPSNSDMSLGEDAESMVRVNSVEITNQVIPYQVYTASAAETSAAAACRRPTQFL
jgi:hypothetical protein